MKKQRSMIRLGRWRLKAILTPTKLTSYITKKAVHPKETPLS